MSSPCRPVEAHDCAVLATGAVTAMSPIQFQKQIRLQEARLLLIADPSDVSGVAYAVGYESPSQFSREYRKTFGAPPGRDAARLRRKISSAL
jgi:AraC-like DNA-binding protein